MSETPPTPLELEAAGMRHVLRRMRDILALPETKDAEGLPVPDVVIDAIDQALSGQLGREMEAEYSAMLLLQFPPRAPIVTDETLQAFLDAYGQDVVWPTKNQPTEAGWYVTGLEPPRTPQIVKIRHSDKDGTLLGFGPLVIRAAKLPNPMLLHIPGESEA